MTRTWTAAACALALSMGWVGPAPASEGRSASTIYKWVDARGDLHATDRLDDVPEPYRSMYVARNKERARQAAEAREGAAPRGPEAPRQTPPQPPASKRPAGSDAPAVADGPRPGDGTGVGALDREIQREAAWRERMAAARRELLAATEALAALDEEIAQAAHNPTLRHTPAVRAQLAELGARRQAAVERVKAARHQLTEVLPARARKEQVPPKWLEP